MPIHVPLMDGHMDVQRETIIPHHYRVVGYKNISKLSAKFILQNAMG